MSRIRGVVGTRTDAALAAVVLAGALARVVAHRGVTYSPADEMTYAVFSCRVARDGLGAYPDLVGAYLADPGAHQYPSPARWAFILPDALVSAMAGCGPSAVAWVSTAAGVALLVVVAVLVRRWFSPAVAVAATAFVATSPLQLLVGRRALGDELVALLVVLGWWAIRRYALRGTGAAWALAAGLLVLGFGAKEILFLALPAMFLPLLVERVRQRRWTPVQAAGDLALVVVPPLLNTLIVAALARSWSANPDLLRAIQAGTDGAYPATYMSGPLHRLPVDLITIAPAVSLVAIAALGLLVDRGSREIRLMAGTAVLGIVPYAVVDAQNLRLIVASETFLAVVAAWGIVTALRGRRWWCGLAVVAVAASNAWMFVELSLRGDLYDPVSDNLMRILGFIP